MARPHKCRKIHSMHELLPMAPVGSDAAVMEKVELNTDEIEAFRLAYHEGLYHQDAAEIMGVSRQTFGRILNKSLRKIADALLNQKSIYFNNSDSASDVIYSKCPFCRVEFRGSKSPCCPNCGRGAGLGNNHQKHYPRRSEYLSKGDNMGQTKIAFSTNNGKTITGHMGRTKHFLIVTINGNKITDRTMVENLMKHDDHPHHEHDHEQGHGQGHHHDHGHSHHSHTDLIKTLEGCSAVFTRTAGPRLIEELKANNIKCYFVDNPDVDTTLEKLINNQLEVEEF
ncbi:MAG: DUF134 domain-containing protein [Calditrichaceae bacterium]